MTAKGMTRDEKQRLYVRLRILRDINDNVPLLEIQKPVALELLNSGYLQGVDGKYSVTARGQQFIESYKDELSIAYAENMRGDKPLRRARHWNSLMQQIHHGAPIVPELHNLRALAQMRRDGFVTESRGQYTLTQEGVKQMQEYQRMLGDATNNTASHKPMTSVERDAVHARLRVLRDINDNVPLTPKQIYLAREMVKGGILSAFGDTFIITARGKRFIDAHRNELEAAYSEQLTPYKHYHRAQVRSPILYGISIGEVPTGRHIDRHIALMKREDLITEKNGRLELTDDGWAWMDNYFDIVKSMPAPTSKDAHSDMDSDYAPLPLEYDDDAPADAPAPEPDDSDDLRAMREDVISTIEEIGGKPVAPHVRILRHLNRLLDRR